jgi:hypothetical protein
MGNKNSKNIQFYIFDNIDKQYLIIIIFLMIEKMIYFKKHSFNHQFNILMYQYIRNHQIYHKIFLLQIYHYMLNIAS